MSNKITILQLIYSLLLVIIFCLIVTTPYIIRRGISFMEEEYIEGLLIIVLSAIGYGIFKLYQGELKKFAKKLSQARYDNMSLEDKLLDSFKYIGTVNVQISAIKSMLGKLQKYPVNKKEMKQVMELLGSTVLNLVPVDWVLLRIVDTKQLRTIRELSQTRGSAILPRHEVSNKNLIEGQSNLRYTVITSSQDNMTIKGFCIFPRVGLTTEQETMLKAVVNQLEMLFIIFDSRFYKFREMDYYNSR